MCIFFFLQFLTLISANLTATGYSPTSTTYDCNSGQVCFSPITTCGPNTNYCSFDMKVQVPSGQKVGVQIETTLGTTSHYAKWGSYAVQGGIGVDGFDSTFYTTTCSNKNFEDLFVRVYCYSPECQYSIILTQSWAENECGMTWQEQAVTACDSSCRQMSQAKCYYAAYARFAPNNSICTAGLGDYVPTVTVCPIDASCDVNSVCRGPYPNTCVNLCSTLNCGMHGICQVNNAKASCLCGSCYSGDFCEIPPTGSWVNQSWDECDCETKIQKRKVNCETSFGCILPDSYCSGEKIETQNCSTSCPFALTTIISEVKGDYFLVTLIGGPSVVLVCCVGMILKCRKTKEVDERYLKIQIPTPIPDPVGISWQGGGSPSHSKQLAVSHRSFPSSGAAPSLSSSSSLSRPLVLPLTPSALSQSQSQSFPSRPKTPQSQRPMTPSQADSIPEESGRSLPVPSAPQSNTEIEVPEYLLQRPPSPFSPQYERSSENMDEKHNSFFPSAPSPEPITESAVPEYIQRPASPYSPEYSNR